MRSRRLPSVVRTPLQQPLFVLGVLFILVVFFVPGGLTRIGQVGVRLDRILRRPATQEEAAMKIEWESTGRRARRCS